MPYVTPLEAAALYAGLNILILVGLSFAVVRARIAHKVVLGDGGNPAVLRAIRAHANAAEYIPAGLVGLIGLALLNSQGGAAPPLPGWTLHAAGVALTLGRALHAVGLSLGERNAGRSLGTLLTWLSLIGMGLALIVGALNPST